MFGIGIDVRRRGGGANVLLLFPSEDTLAIREYNYIPTQLTANRKFRTWKNSPRQVDRRKCCQQSTDDRRLYLSHPSTSRFVYLARLRVARIRLRLQLARWYTDTFAG